MMGAAETVPAPRNARATSASVLAFMLPPKLSLRSDGRREALFEPCKKFTFNQRPMTGAYWPSRSCVMPTDTTCAPPCGGDDAAWLPRDRRSAPARIPAAAAAACRALARRRHPYAAISRRYVRWCARSRHHDRVKGATALYRGSRRRVPSRSGCRAPESFAQHPTGGYLPGWGR